ncbi:Ppx/GppA phosphatase family protein [Bdellovibrio bacteriovorus]|uniref:Ppx/GppA phosphatase family protein n=1 Tax=Bdellovibrio TaxID=958 RepID=UPI0035A8F7BC
MMKSVLLVGSFVFLSSVSFAKDCQEKHGALDFGSGTTKAFAAIVDVCKKQIVEVIYEERLPLALNEALEKSETKEIPSSVVNEALPRFQSLVKKMKDLGVGKIYAVATSVFRVAKNGSEVAKKISTEIQIPVNVISQEREAELGFWSALAQKKVSINDPIIVWDIGGGSMQMYARRQGKVHVFQGNLASVTFKNQILEVLQFKSPKSFSSPNPIGAQREAALQLAKNHAYLNVPTFFKKEAVKSRWIGVGGVLSMSVQRQVNKEAKEFTQVELDQTLKQRVHLKDSEIDSDYRVSDISNLALVLGYMQALKIPKVETAQASLGQGLIFYSLHGR